MESLDKSSGGSPLMSVSVSLSRPVGEGEKGGPWLAGGV
jgi:hypothetical protein